MRQGLATGFQSEAFVRTPGIHPGVLASAMTGLDHFIRDAGGNPDRVLARAGLARHQLSSPTGSIGLVEYCEVIEEAAHATGTDNFGLRFGQQLHPQSLGLIGYIGLTSPTIGAALQNFVEDFKWHQHDTEIRIVEQEEAWRLEYQIRHGAILVRRQNAEMMLGVHQNLIRAACGPNWSPLEVFFEHARPRDWREHENAFGAPVWFEQPCNALLIPKADLARRMPAHDPLLLPLLRQVIRQMAGGRTASSQSVIDQVRAHIALKLPEGDATLDAVSAAMGCPAWLLQRRLRREGVSYLEVLEGVRCELARYHLRENARPISEVALLLGYSEVSAFSRAFRRWFGMSPRCWMKEMPPERG